MPTVPPGKVAGVTDTAPRMLMLRFLVMVRDFASVTCTPKPKLPIVVGVPEIVPEVLSKLKPTGKLPETMLHVKGPVPVPLLTCSLVLSGTLTAPAGNVNSAITGPPCTKGLWPPQAARDTQRISANPSAVNALHELIGSPWDLLLRAPANTNHRSRPAFYTLNRDKLEVRCKKPACVHHSSS